MSKQSFVLGCHVKIFFVNLLLCLNMMGPLNSKENTSLSCKRYNKKNYHTEHCYVILRFENKNISRIITL